MKSIILYSAVLIAFCMGCSEDENVLPVVEPEATGTLTDVEGNEYGWVRYAGLDWMTSNYKAGKSYLELTDRWGDALINNANQEDYLIYGNLYTYEEAKANAPEGWRLPTDEDWKKLEKALGMDPAELDALGWRGSVEGLLIQQKETGSLIHLQLSGVIMLGETQSSLFLRHVREYGCYWTSTVDVTYTNSIAVYIRRIRYNSSQIERGITTIGDESYAGLNNKYMAVRYVRDVK